MNVEQAKIAEAAGAVAVMALERIPADIRRDGGVARTTDPALILEIKNAVTIPVMAKARIGHFVEAQILEACEIDYIDGLPKSSPWRMTCITWTRSNSMFPLSADVVILGARPFVVWPKEPACFVPKERRERATLWRRFVTLGCVQGGFDSWLPFPRTSSLWRPRNFGHPTSLFKDLLDSLRQHASFYYEYKTPARFELEEDTEHNCYCLRCTTEENGRSKKMSVDFELLISPDMMALKKIAAVLKGAGEPPFMIEDQDKQLEAATLSAVLHYILERGRKAQEIQRYKGLGEMNPEQLWETTMEPENRHMLQVKIEDGVEADEVFTILMGDEVEPRRNFIYENALHVQNLEYLKKNAAVKKQKALAQQTSPKKERRQGM